MSIDTTISFAVAALALLGAWYLLSQARRTHRRIARRMQQPDRIVPAAAPAKRRRRTVKAAKP